MQVQGIFVCRSFWAGNEDNPQNGTTHAVRYRWKRNGDVYFLTIEGEKLEEFEQTQLEKLILSI